MSDSADTAQTEADQAHHQHPPDLAEGATQLVLRQAELSTENAE